MLELKHTLNTQRYTLFPFNRWACNTIQQLQTFEKIKLFHKSNRIHPYLLNPIETIQIYTCITSSPVYMAQQIRVVCLILDKSLVLSHPGPMVTGMDPAISLSPLQIFKF